MPRFSILTAAFNGADYLPRLVESVRGQSFQDWEHLVIDDGSADGGRTMSYLESQGHIRWWTKKNSGQYDTQNHLLQSAQGEICTIINQDDAYIDDQVLADVHRRFAAEDSPDVVYGDVGYMNEAGEELPYRYAFTGERSDWLLSNVSCVFHIALFFRRSLVEEHDLFFDPEYRMAGDWDWNLRLFKAARHIVHIGRPLALFRVHGGQKTLSVGERGFKPEVAKICRKHDISPAVNSLLRSYINQKTRLMSFVEILRREGIAGAVRRVKRKLFGHRE